MAGQIYHISIIYTIYIAPKATNKFGCGHIQGIIQDATPNNTLFLEYLQ
jgi:hypothetical protein